MASHPTGVCSKRKYSYCAVKDSKKLKDLLEYSTSESEPEYDSPPLDVSAGAEPEASDGESKDMPVTRKELNVPRLHKTVSEVNHVNC